MNTTWDHSIKYVWYRISHDQLYVYGDDEDIWLKAFYKGDDMFYVGEL